MQTNELWTIFQSEYQEHLDEADRCIYQIVSMQEYDAKEVLHQMFRSFHSLKGLARAMELKDLEKITHSCEDYLNFLLEHSDQLNEDTALELGSIVEEIQELCQEIAKEQKDISPRDELIQRVLALNIPEQSIPQLSQKEEAPLFFDFSEEEGVESLAKESSPDSAPSPNAQEARPPLVKEGAPELEKSIRVSGGTLERFMDNIGEIVLNNARLTHFLADKRYKDLLAEVLFLIKDNHHVQDLVSEKIRSLIDQIEFKNENLNDSIQSLHSSLTVLHDTALDLRVVPMELIYRRLPKTVKLIAKELEKEVNLKLEGHDVQIDKIMVDAFSDPILHILRNAIDHGIESPDVRVQKGKSRTGTITIKTEQKGSRIQLQIKDDGRGIDTAKIIKKILEKNILLPQEVEHLSEEQIMQFIFHPGFSTAETVSSISGRGVGMDIVRTNVMHLGGAIQIFSEPEKGTTFTIKVPITAAIQDVLIVSSNGQTIAIPNSYVSEVLQLDPSEIHVLRNNPACILRDSYLPLLNLGYALGFSKEKLSHNLVHSIVVISRMDATLGIEVDKVLEKTQIYMKELGANITSVFGVGGATIRGDGEVMIILDSEDILDSIS
jgi:two-component system chemotaxis sensor kinase CheA